MFALTPETWTAIAAWLTALVAISTAIFAAWQVMEARRTREEQAQPYVVVYMESTISPEFIDLVVRNFGTTAAHSVKLSATPVLVRTSDAGVEAVKFPDEIPTLAPGQEWRTFWDRDMDRKGTDLPDRHEVTVTYRDSRGKPFTLESRLDWTIYEGTYWVSKKGLHDLAKSVERISKAVSRWKDPSGALPVITRDGDKQDERRAERLRELREGRAAVAEESEARPSGLIAVQEPDGGAPT